MNSARLKFAIVFMVLISSMPAFSHPTGNMISVGEHVLWSYIHPINDLEHHASVMIWSKETSPQVLVSSQFPSSDYMLYNKENDIYLIERRYLQPQQTFQIRILKMRLGEEPTQIWNWFEDDWRIGEGGFFMIDDTHIVFGRYPNIYSLRKGETPVKYFNFSASIRRIRAVEDNRILLLGEKSCWLADQNGTVIKEWDDLIKEQVKDSPLDRNQIFDADFKNGNLLLAYWGKRSFDLIDDLGKRKTILQLRRPMVPHWVAFYRKELLLFSSKLLFNQETPKPNLSIYRKGGSLIDIWNYKE